MNPPLIGVPARAFLVSGRNETFFGVFGSYLACLRSAGAAAVVLTIGDTNIVERLDGLLLTGGEDPADPDWWTSGAPSAPLDPERDTFELALIRTACARGTPTLGVCRGAQLVNVARGGALRRLPKQALEAHLGQSNGVEHLVAISNGTRLGAVIGAERPITTLSRHSVSLDRLGEGLVASGHSSDGEVEAIESADWPFIGVQWHPEWARVDGTRQTRLFEWLARTAQERMTR